MKKIFRFIVVTLALVGSGAIAQAQQLKKVPRLGLLSVGSDPAKPVVWLPFLEKMLELGYVESQNIALERRFGEGKIQRLPELVAGLVSAKVDIVGATGTSENKAAKQAQPQRKADQPLAETGKRHSRISTIRVRWKE